MTYKVIIPIFIKIPDRHWTIGKKPYQNKNSNLELNFHNKINTEFNAITKYFKLLYINEKKKEVLITNDYKKNTHKLNAFLTPEETMLEVEVALIFDKSKAFADQYFFDELDDFFAFCASNDNKTPLLSCSVSGHYIKEKEGDKTPILSQLVLTNLLKNNLVDYSDKPKFEYIFFDENSNPIKKFKNLEEVEEVELRYKHSEKAEKYLQKYPGYDKLQVNKMIEFFKDSKVKTS